MAEHTHSRTTHVGPEAVWDFVREMDRWAPFMLGYQAHRKRSETESLWTLKGDVGSLTRQVDFRVLITEWTEPRRVRFTLEGIGEDMQGEGSLEIEALDGSEPCADGAASERPAPGYFARLWAALVGRLMGRRVGSRASNGSGRSGAPAATRLTFFMRLTPRGVMAPMLEAMIQPVMIATAEHLADRIIVHLETQPGAPVRAS